MVIVNVDNNWNRVRLNLEFEHKEILLATFAWCTMVEIQLSSLPTTGLASNIYMTGSGFLQKSTATSYTTEEVDKKLAVKDKLIEKLSERLDKLEKKLKKTK